MSHDTGFSQRFIIEAREHITAMTSAMLALEQDKDPAEPLIEQLLRAAHSIKGGAGLTGCRNIEQLSHAFEEVVEYVRDGRLSRRPEVIDNLLAALDRLAALIDDLDRSDEADISEPLSQLRSLVAAPTALATTTAPGRESKLTATASPKEFEVTDRARQARPPDEIYLYGVKLDWWQCERHCGLSPVVVSERLERAGSVLDARTRVGGPPFREGLPRPPYWHLAVVSSRLPLEAFIKALDIPCAMILLLEPSSGAETPRSATAEPVRARSGSAPTTLRVSVPLVDRMMALAGELVLVRNQALRSTDRSNSPMRRLMRRLDALTNELQDAALRMRTQPVGTLFDRFPRVVRDLARQLNKQIDVHITGAEVELDKTIIEMLADPLTHLVRNCCDHGIETPEQRSRAGKPAAGRIDLSARQERGQIVIEIRDDGRGLDVQAIKRKATESGVRRREELERMADQQVFGLILLSGFSTAQRVTDLSGRGVGMDVVKTNLDQVGGVVEIDSSAGQGSVFTLRLPLTLAIMPCLLIGSDGHCFGIPQRDVEEILLLGDRHSRRRIEQNHEGEVLRWRGRLLPAIRLRDVLKHRRPLDARALAEVAGRYHGEDAHASRSYAAVVRLGSRRFAAVFDEVLGSENIVVKPLHPLLRALGIYAATTILGDGQVALIFSGEGLARHSGIIDRMVIEAAEALPGPAPQAATERLLLFRSGPAELLAVRMDAVRRVVAIAPKQIECIGQREMVNVDGTASSILRLEQLLDLSPCAQVDRLSLLLPRNGDAPLGVLASAIVDTPTLALQLETRSYQADGVLGSFMVGGEIALLLDLDRIVAMWRAGLPAAPAKLPDSARRRVLVVDDTQFFQKLVRDYLQGEGYEVRVAENGREALALLESEPVDAVVSDLEMPIMDGHAFARAVRSDPRLAGLPLVALTTLNTPESRATATQNGFDAYEVKLDRQTLLSTLATVMARAHRQIQPIGAPPNE